MKMDKVANSGNDEFYTPEYAISPILKYVRHGAVVWCPFDTENSLFVKAFEKMGCKVIATHILHGQDFFAMQPPECDYIISNPPYSKKARYYIGCLKLGNHLQCCLVWSAFLKAKNALKCLETTVLKLCISTDEFRISNPMKTKSRL